MVSVYGCSRCFGSDEMFSSEYHCLGCLLSMIMIHNQM
jgi:hypothetical protein